MNARRRSHAQAGRGPGPEQADRPRPDGEATTSPDPPTTAGGELSPPPQVQHAEARSHPPPEPAPVARPPVLRPDRSPVDQRDFDDRHDTRATTDDPTLERYIALERHRIERDWQRLLQHLVSITAYAILYVTIVVALQYLLVQITIPQAMTIAGTALGTAYGGYALYHAGSYLQRRYGRQRGSRNDPAS
jgi:hypothetical protein